MCPPACVQTTQPCPHCLFSLTHKHMCKFFNLIFSKLAYNVLDSTAFLHKVWNYSFEKKNQVLWKVRKIQQENPGLIQLGLNKMKLKIVLINYMSPWRRYKYFCRSQAKTQNIRLFNACILITFYKFLQHLEARKHPIHMKHGTNVAIHSLTSIIKQYKKNRAAVHTDT